MNTLPEGYMVLSEKSEPEFMGDELTHTVKFQLPNGEVRYAVTKEPLEELYNFLNGLIRAKIL